MAVTPGRQLGVRSNRTAATRRVGGHAVAWGIAPEALGVALAAPTTTQRRAWSGPGRPQRVSAAAQVPRGAHGAQLARRPHRWLDPG
jgi:hypothetical protein